MLSFAVGFIVSLLVTLLIVRYAHLHERFSIDNDLAGGQKLHARPGGRRARGCVRRSTAGYAPMTKYAERAR